MTDYKEKFEKMRVAGKLASKTLDMLTDYIKPGVSTNKIDNSSCVYFEDIEKNLRPAHKLGITTVHITDKNPTIKKSYVDFRFKTIISALDMINKNF